MMIWIWKIDGAPGNARAAPAASKKASPVMMATRHGYTVQGLPRQTFVLLVFFWAEQPPHLRPTSARKLNLKPLTCIIASFGIEAYQLRRLQKGHGNGSFSFLTYPCHQTPFRPRLELLQCFQLLIGDPLMGSPSITGDAFYEAVGLSMQRSRSFSLCR